MNQLGPLVGCILNLSKSQWKKLIHEVEDYDLADLTP